MTNSQFSIITSIVNEIIMTPSKIAILDDYQGFADSRFDKLDSTRYEITSFKDTLLPYGHPDTPQSVKDELVKRLEPFDIICKNNLQV